MNAGIIEIDVHGMNCSQALVAVNAKLRLAKGAYRIRVIHGFHGGSALKDMVREEYSQHPKVRRLETRLGDGVTDLILREL